MVHIMFFSVNYVRRVPKTGIHPCTLHQARVNFSRPAGRRSPFEVAAWIGEGLDRPEAGPAGWTGLACSGLTGEDTGPTGLADWVRIVLAGGAGAPFRLMGTIPMGAMMNWDFRRSLWDKRLIARWAPADAVVLLIETVTQDLGAEPAAGLELAQVVEEPAQGGARGG